MDHRRVRQACRRRSTRTPATGSRACAAVAVGRDGRYAGFHIVGFEHVTAALERGTGAILALPHLGGWEWAGRWLADQGHRMTVVVERIEPPELFDWFVRLRNELGMTVVPLGPVPRSAVLQALRDNEIVCLLCDRDIQGGGVEVEFFGERTTLPAGPATLALRSGAPILPVGVYFTGGSTATTPSSARRSRRARAGCATTSPGSPRRSPPSSSSSSAGPPSSGTCSSPTGPATGGKTVIYSRTNEEVRLTPSIPMLGW